MGVSNPLTPPPLVLRPWYMEYNMEYEIKDNGIDQNTILVTIFMDLSKLFGTFNHNLLLGKLNA